MRKTYIILTHSKLKLVKEKSGCGWDCCTSLHILLYIYYVILRRIFYETMSTVTVMGLVVL